MDGDVVRLAAARPSSAAHVVGLVLDPRLVLGLLLVVVAFVDVPATDRVWILSVSVGGVLVVPSALLHFAVRSGRASDRQVVRRHERHLLYAGSLASVVVALLLLVVWGAPRPVWATVAAMTIGLAACAVANLMTKVSLHVGVAAGALVILVVELGRWGFLWLPLVVLVIWARLREGRHSVPQAALGALLGLAAGAAVVPLR